MVDGVILVMTCAPAAQPGTPARGPGAPRRDDAEAHPAVELHAAVAEVGAGAERGRSAALHGHRQLRAHHARHGRLPRAARALPAADRGDERAGARQGRGACGSGGGRPGTVRVGGAADPRRLRHRHAIPSARWRGSAEEAAAAARAIGGPVALKVQSADILHKTEAGAVALNLRSPEHVRAAYDTVLASARRHAPSARVLGVLVQPMAAAGREIILGVKRDATFGPLLMVGLGGVAVEVLKDVALAPVPLTRRATRGRCWPA